MSFELESFGIRTILVEPGIIKTNFIQSSKLAKKASDMNSPYKSYIQNMEKGMKKLVESGQDPEFVAKIILEAIIDDNPKLRYLAGEDVRQILEIRRNYQMKIFIVC